MFQRRSSSKDQLQFPSVVNAIAKRKLLRSSREDAVRRARRVQIVLAVSFLTTLKLMTSAFFSRPQVTTLFMIWLLGVAFFVSTEASGVLHTSQKTENKFWMGMACTLAIMLLFLADDSPFRVPSSKRGFVVGLMLVSAATYLVHIVHKRSHRQALENRSSIPKNKSYREAISSLADDSAGLGDLVAEVNASLSRLESALIPGGFRRIFDKNSLLNSELKVIECFRYASRAQLNYLVLHVNMNVVIYRLKNHYNRKKDAIAAAAAAKGKAILTNQSSTVSNSTLGSTRSISSRFFAADSRQTSSSSVVSSTASLGGNAQTTLASFGSDSHSEKSLMASLPIEAPSAMSLLAEMPKQMLEGGSDDVPASELPAKIPEETEDAEEDEEFETREEELNGASSTDYYEETVESDLAKRNHRNALVQLLAKERLADLTTSARASVLDAIQVIGMMRNPHTKDRAQRWAASIILDTRADQLSELKTITDAKASVHSMHKLVYNDITDEAIRASLLSHFQANKRTKLGRKVLSDVDDTLLASGGAYPAGIDDSYPRHCIYPGAGAFYESLDRGVSSDKPSFYGSKVDVETDSEGEEDWTISGPGNRAKTPKKRVVVGNLVFLSARPHVYKDMAERRVYSKFERMIRAKNLHAMPTLLPGDLESGQAYMLRGDFEPMARKKLKNMVEYHSIYPEFTHIFICDNGQADVRAAELMKERLGDTLEAVYVHQVQPLDKTFGYTEASYQKWQKMGIVFYKTFVGAATDACAKNFVEPSALRQVCLTCAQEFQDISSLSGSRFPGGLYGIEERRLELTTDFVRANDLLESRGFQAVKPPRALCMFPVGTTVHTRNFGEGFVRAFRPVDGVYEIALLGDTLIGHFVALDLKTVSWGRTQSGLFPGGSTASYNGPHVSIQVGCRVSTPFGEGVVRRYRPSDQIFEVIITKWPALAFLRQESVEAVELGDKSRSRRIWGYGQALIRRTFSSTLKSPSPTMKPNMLSSVAGTISAAVTTTTTTLTSPHLTISVAAPVATPINIVVVNKFEVGARVVVPSFGPATVITETRKEDNIVQIKFDNFQAVGYVNASTLTSVEPRNFLSLSLPVSAAARVMSAMFGTSNSLSASKKPSTPSQVITPYGNGVVVPELSDAPRTDDIVRVRLDWGADAFLNKAEVSKVESVATGGVKSRILSLLSRTESPELKAKKHVIFTPEPQTYVESEGNAANYSGVVYTLEML